MVKELILANIKRRLKQWFFVFVFQLKKGKKKNLRQCKGVSPYLYLYIFKNRMPTHVRSKFQKCSSRPTNSTTLSTPLPFFFLHSFNLVTSVKEKRKLSRIHQEPLMPLSTVKITALVYNRFYLNRFFSTNEQCLPTPLRIIINGSV